MGGPETREEGEFYFHYDRKDRLKSVDAKIKQRAFNTGRKGFWHMVRENKRLGITFADLIIILLLAFLLVPFLSRLADKEDWGPLRFQLKAYEFDGETFVSLKVANKEEELQAKTDPIKVTFFLDNESFQEYWLAVPSPGTEGEFLRHKFPFSGKEVQAHILWKDSRKVLQKSVDKE